MRFFVSFMLMSLYPIMGIGQFVHPGMLHSKQDLAFVKARISSGAEPWKSSWVNLKTSPTAQLTWTAKPVKVIEVGFYSKPDIGGTDFRNDGLAAYSCALRYALGGDKAYAEKAIEIINAWSYTLDSVTNGNKKLLVGMVGIKFLNAAEILKHQYTGWKKQDQEAFKKMVMNVWFPLLKDFMPGYNGNWDAAIAQTVIGIGVFMDRRDIFDLACNQILKGESNGAINHYFNEWGQCQESGRDQGHTQMGLGFLSIVCEIAWKQKKDLYSAYENRLALGYEYTARYMLGEDVKYVRYKTFQGKTVFGDSISAIGRGKFSPIYERAYHHYHNRLKLPMPFTKRALDKTRPEEESTGYLPWATLMTTAF
ncbi:alginate lyase family protein [Dyadobacter sp. CY312]|uniref:alginate lyase family protein n=1 Tax=Dyadobacter sp. CY312 TaxID=2907303 RepID=UPI001F1F3530|nr:alginate lyase family protein [Dyadobacter sp. CY312]MCE7043218.1 alginate lyase family protein [Dyadobacter sp. CY312]